jgi:membrane-associated phospholipid phosphatase
MSVCAQNPDINLLRDINLSRNKSFDPSFKLISQSATPVSVSLPISFLVYGYTSGDKTFIRRGWQTGLSITGSMALSTLLKYTINRSRPYKKYSDIENLTSDFTPSFPSGHTTSAFSTATTLSLMYPKWYVIIPSYTWASAVAYSRLHMGMHYPLDILGGIIIGVGTSYLSYRLQGRFK